jgi:hypothetical protein
MKKVCHGMGKLQIKVIQAVFYRNSAGTEPVRDWLLMEMDAADRKIIGTDIRTVEMGWPIGNAGLPTNRRRTLRSAQQYRQWRCPRPVLRPRWQDGFAAWLRQEVAENSGWRSGTRTETKEGG